MIESLGQFHFIRPLTLLLAPLAIFFWWLWQRRTDPLRGWREQMDPDLLEALVIGRESSHSDSARWILVAWLIGRHRHRWADLAARAEPLRRRWHPADDSLEGRHQHGAGRIPPHRGSNARV